MSYRFISAKVHGALDYIVAIALIFAPMIFGFQSIGGAAVVIPMVLGAALFLYSILTNYEWGVIRAISMPTHLTVDMVAGVILLVSPLLFGFSDEAVNAWLPHVVVGVVVLLLPVFSQKQPAKPEVRSM